MNEIIPSGEFRARARKAIQANIHVAILITFVALLPALIRSAAEAIAQKPVLEVYQQQIVTLRNTGTIPDENTLFAEIMASLGTVQYIALGAIVLLLLVQPFLELGWKACLLRILRGEPVEIQDVFCRKSCFFKGIGLVLLQGLKMLVWMIPGMIGYMICTVLMVVIDSILFLYLGIACMIASVVMGLRAAMHYSMSTYFMAEHPEWGIRMCIKSSVDVMRNRKMQLAMLYLSFIGWMFLASLVTSLLSFSSILALTVQMALTIPLNLYMTTAFCAFYEQYR